MSTCPESTVRSSEYISWRPRARPHCEPAVNRAGPAAPSPWHPPRHNLRRSLLSSRSSLIGMSRRWTQPPGGLTFLGGSETLPASNRRSGGVKRLGIPQERKAHRRPHSKSATGNHDPFRGQLLDVYSDRGWPCSGRVRNGSAGRTLLRPVRSAPRSGLIERRQTQREGNRDHEIDDHGAGLR